jgi:hypothetical protein
MPTHQLLILLLLANTASRPLQQTSVGPATAQAVNADFTALVAQLVSGCVGRSLTLIAVAPGHSSTGTQWAGKKSVRPRAVSSWLPGTEYRTKCCYSRHILCYFGTGDVRWLPDNLRKMPQDKPLNACWDCRSTMQVIKSI